MAWRFAKVSAITHWLISTQVTHHKEQPSVGAFGSYEPAASPAPTRSPPPSYGAQPTPAADPFTDPYDVAEAKAEDLYVEGETQEVPQRKPRIGLGALAKLGGAASRARKAAACVDIKILRRVRADRRVVLHAIDATPAR